jgi:hypothetical protein
MHPSPCLDSSERLAAAASGGTLAGSRRAHLAACSHCSDEVAALRQLGHALAVLGQAERSAAPAASDLAARVQARLLRPPLYDRLPVAIASAGRTAATLARPALAASCIALAAGAGAGAYLAQSARSVTAPDAGAGAEVFVASNLDGSGAPDFEAAFLDAGDAGDAGHATDANAADTSGPGGVR